MVEYNIQLGADNVFLIHREGREVDSDNSLSWILQLSAGCVLGYNITLQMNV